MKIRCDVCDQAEASVFCSADEAALCDGCDRRVHHANKLASKHMRFSLLQPNSSKEAPLCDICQERRAFLFCREDRAILCRECDIPIHKANELTQKHNRFLLTGVKLSASSFSYPSSISSSSTSGGCEEEENSKPGNNNNNNNRAAFHSHQLHPTSLLKKSTTRESIFSSVLHDDYHHHHNNNNNAGSENGSISTSSISEYLENLPGWRVDDLLEVDPSFASISSTFSSKNWEPNLELVDRQDLESHWSSTTTTTTNGCLWVPQVSPKSPQVPMFFPQDGFLVKPKEANSLRVGRRWDVEDGFTVPQISPPPSVKKSRHFLYWG